MDEEQIVPEIEEMPLVGMKDSDMVLVCTLVIKGIPVMYEWLPKREADARVRQIYVGELANV